MVKYPTPIANESQKQKDPGLPPKFDFGVCSCVCDLHGAPRSSKLKVLEAGGGLVFLLPVLLLPALFGCEAQVLCSASISLLSDSGFQDRCHLIEAPRGFTRFAQLAEDKQPTAASRTRCRSSDKLFHELSRNNASPGVHSQLHSTNLLVDVFHELDHKVNQLLLPHLLKMSMRH